MQKGFVPTLFLPALIVAVLFISVYWEDKWKINFFSRIEPARVCNVGLWKAQNFQTGECRQFPTSCDIPKEWEMVSSCP